MGTSTNIRTYTDVHQVLMAAKKAGSANFRLETPGQARHWLQRANSYAKLLGKEHSVYPFDNLNWQISKADPCVVMIGAVEVTGELTDAEGNPIAIDKVMPRDLLKPGLATPEGAPIAASPLEAEVEDLAEKILKGGPFNE